MDGACAVIVEGRRQVNAIAKKALYHFSPRWAVGEQASRTILCGARCRHRFRNHCEWICRGAERCTLNLTTHRSGTTRHS